MQKTANQITQDVTEELLFDPAVEEANITVTSEYDGLVTLDGTVGSYFELDRATYDAWRVYGVSDVSNELSVDPPSDYLRADADIAAAANNALFWNSSVPEAAITISVDDGWVSLDGEVEYRYQRQAAVDAVSDLIGVTGVSDHIKLLPRKEVEGDIESQIYGALTRYAETDKDKIKVHTSNGKVTLRGDVHSWAERDDAEQAAWMAPGVVDVENNLKVKNGS